MRYDLCHIDVAEPLPAIRVGDDASGVGVVVREAGRPVGFWMERLAGGTRLSEAEVERRVAGHCGEALLRRRVRRELRVPGAVGGPGSLTLAVCTKDRPALVERLLASLSALGAEASARGVLLEVLVVDNAPSDARTGGVASAAGVRHVVEPKAGLDFARNRALAECGTEWLAFVDDDVVVDPGWLGGFCDAVAENPDAGAVTGLVLPLELESEAQVVFESRGGFRRGFERLRYRGSDLPGHPLYPCGAGVFGAGANMAFRRSVLVELGGFDDALDTGRPLPGGGDLDINYRVVRAGHALVYEPRCLVFHEHRRDLAGLRRQYGSWGKGFMAFVAKHRSADAAMRPRFNRLIAWWFEDQLRQLRKSLLGRHPLPPGMVLAELWGGVVGLCGEYGRSRARVAAIRAAAGASSGPGSAGAVSEEGGHGQPVATR